jgi:signal transduction histidine kinase
MTAAQPEFGSERPATVPPRAIQRDRMKGAQDVAAALARELRNPVFAIASAAHLLRYRVIDDPVIEKNIGRILREADRLNAYVNALLEYGVPRPMKFIPGNPDDVWAAVIAQHRGDLESKAILANHTRAESAANCNLDAEQFGHALSCALTNAIEAAPEGSDIDIQSIATADGIWVSVVQNDAARLDDETLARAFEPLVTNKPGHAGIGLTLAQRILTDHSGSIALRAEGTRAALTFTLPTLHG